MPRTNDMTVHIAVIGSRSQMSAARSRAFVTSSRRRWTGFAASTSLLSALASSSHSVTLSDLHVPSQQFPAVSYTIRVTTKVSGTAPLGSESDASAGSWSGSAILTKNRGRIDIKDGKLPGLFSKGDFILFDAGDAVTVHPDGKSFSPLLLARQDSNPSSISASGLRVALSNIVVTVDSEQPPVTIDGRLTTRYRIHATYSMTIDMSSIPGLESIEARRTDTEQTTEYFYADIPEVVQGALFTLPNTLRPSRKTDYLEELTATLLKAMSSLPGNKIAVKTIATTRIVGTDISSVRETTTEILQVQSLRTDVGRFVVPSDYRLIRAGNPAEGASSVDTGEKWRRPPLTSN